MNLMKCYEPFQGWGGKYLFCKEFPLQNKFRKAKRAFFASLNFIWFICIDNNGTRWSVTSYFMNLMKFYEVVIFNVFFMPCIKVRARHGRLMKRL